MVVGFDCALRVRSALRVSFMAAKMMLRGPTKPANGSGEASLPISVAGAKATLTSVRYGLQPVPVTAIRGTNKTVEAADDDRD